MSHLPILPTDQLLVFLDVIQDSLAIRRHQDLLHWLNGGVQRLVPHDILIAAWGDFSIGLVHLDVVSYLPGLRTTEINKENLLPDLLKLYGRWIESSRTPFSITMSGERIHFSSRNGNNGFDKGIAMMRSAMVQGIKDERGQYDCLYVALSENPDFATTEILSMQLLLPYIDTALRKVDHLSMQNPAPEAIVGDGNEDTHQNPNLFGLTKREIEIMQWVCSGKTNAEIGLILDISAFTVKNHMQRIFRKLNVTNRAQAITVLGNFNTVANG